MHLYMQPSANDGHTGYAPYPFHRTLIEKLYLYGICVIICALFLSWSALNYAGEWNLLVNGKSIHTSERSSGKPYNEDNWGVGAQYDFGSIDSRWNKFIMVSGFLDSNKETSYYVGGGNARRFMLSEELNYFHVDLGLVAFLMTRKDHHAGRPFLGVLPMISVGIQDISVNITYVPEVSPKMVELWFFQLKVSERKFW